MEIRPGLIIPDRELKLSFTHASGPGGQNVNKIESAVQLRFNVADSIFLTAEVKERLIILAGSRMTRSGDLIIEAKRYRSQDKNRLDAEQRLVKLIQKALLPPQKRLATRPSSAARLRRLETKKQRALTKHNRQIPSVNDD